MIQIQNGKQELLCLQLVYLQVWFQFPFLNYEYRLLPPVGVDGLFLIQEVLFIAKYKSPSHQKV